MVQSSQWYSHLDDMVTSMIRTLLLHPYSEIWSFTPKSPPTVTVSHIRAAMISFTASLRPTKQTANNVYSNGNLACLRPWPVENSLKKLGLQLSWVTLWTQILTWWVDFTKKCGLWPSSGGVVGVAKECCALPITLLFRNAVSNPL